MTWIIRLLLFLLLLVFLRRMVSRIWSGFSFLLSPDRKGTSASPSREKVEGHMYKDPQCGTYVARSLAVPLKRGDQTEYFCSEECRDRYRESLSLHR